MQKLLNSSLKQKFVALTAVLIVIVLIISATLIVNFRGMIQLSDTIQQREIVVLNKAAELKLAVVQVQQWLQDISATAARMDWLTALMRLKKVPPVSFIS